MNIKPFNYLARKILYLWVKTEILPPSKNQLKIAPNKPVLYVVESRGWSNLLVLEHECAKLGLVSPVSRLSSKELRNWHSVYTIAPRQPFKAWMQNQPKRSRMIRGLVETLRENPKLDIQVVPVSIFWGRPVAKQQSAITILFAHSWAIAGRTRQFLKILIHGRNTLVQYSEAFSLRGLIDDSRGNDSNIDTIQQTLSLHLYSIKTATLGPDTSHRSTLVRDLLMIPDVQDAIQKRSIEENKSLYESTLQARKYLYEIVADNTSITIRLMQIGLTAFWNKFYSGIEVKHAEQLRQLARTHTLIYVPCHRSHVDYLLLSYVIHYEGLSIPHIAAGKNLNMPVIGPVFRGGGAFFIRRSFKGNELYSRLMFEYLAKLVSMGAPVEYFVEGGRSRTGRLLQPKPGMLAMTVRAFLKYRQRPVAFIPVYVGYEKMLEGKAYLAELSGKDKKSESLFTSIRAILGIRGNYGNVYTNFGNPVYLSNFLDKHNPAWPQQEYDDNNRPEWVKQTVNDVANNIMCNINSAVYVNSINLVSTVLLVTPRQHMDEAQLASMIEIITSLIHSLDYSDKVSVVPLSGAEQIIRAEKLKRVKRRKHAMGDIIYLDAKHSVLLTYYRNNILHLTALLSVVACCFNNASTQTMKQITDQVKLVYPFLKSQLFIHWDAEQLPDVINRIVGQLVDLNLLRKGSGDKYLKPRATRIERAQLELLARIASPLLTVYYMTFAILLNTGSNKISQPDLVNLSHLLAQRVSMIYELNSPDFFDSKLINNFIDTLKSIKYVTINDEDRLVYNTETLEQAEGVVLLLNQDIRSNILQLLRTDQPGT
jgi:glycerol-3-phosphate O-acyltransferase